MTDSEYVYDPVLDRWVHSETGVSIHAEDMPWELTPEDMTDE